METIYLVKQVVHCSFENDCSNNYEVHSAWTSNEIAEVIAKGLAEKHLKDWFGSLNLDSVPEYQITNMKNLSKNSAKVIKIPLDDMGVRNFYLRKL